MSTKPLDFSVPANNEKIIEIYKKIKNGQLNPSPDFQRKLVWKRQHKINFIKTILMKYPFPEIYKAPGELDVNTLELADLIVDGQQRVTTIKNFIDGKDVFALEKTSPKFSELTDDEKKDFLNYEVSVRYLKNADKAQIKEIFQRINNTEYSLNSMERLNAQWGDSEFVCYGKQLVEDDPAIDLDLLVYKMPEDYRKSFLKFFHDNKIFTENDNDRMLSLQYILTLVATLVKGSYFRRNTETQGYIELYNDDFDSAQEVTEELYRVIMFIESMDLPDGSYWFNKSNIFTLICELYKRETNSLDPIALKDQLTIIDNQRTIHQSDPGSVNADIAKYFDLAREAVNEISAREFRGEIISKAMQNAIDFGRLETSATT